MVKATTKNQFMEEQTGIIPTSLFRIESQLKYNSYYPGYTSLVKYQYESGIANNELRPVHTHYAFWFNKYAFNINNYAFNIANYELCIMNSF